ncbi:hypothetical protein PsSCT_25750 [Pseudomonas sp. SCT]
MHCGAAVPYCSGHGRHQAETGFAPAATVRPSRIRNLSSQQSEVNTMSKGMDAKKNGKKKPMKTAQEKRMAKRDKKSGSSTTLLGTHAATH